jgi:hypothetical protein
MPKSPRHRVVAVWLLGGRYDADGWLEIRAREPDVPWWEARCTVVRWDHRELTGSLPVTVRVELAAGAKLSGRAYVDQARHLWGWKKDEADLKVHGLPGFDFRVARSPS